MMDVLVDDSIVYRCFTDDHVLLAEDEDDASFMLRMLEEESLGFRRTKNGIYLLILIKHCILLLVERYVTSVIRIM